MGAAACVLVNRQQRRHSAAFAVNTPQQVSRALGRDHDDVHIFGRNDGLKVNAEAMRDTENLAGVESGLDLRLVEVALGLVRRQDLYPIGPFSGLGGGQYGHAISLCLLSAGTLRVKPDNHVVATVAQILRLCVALASVSENCNGL